MKQRLEDIWERARDGDRSAWTVIVTRFSPLVFTVARRCGLSADDAEDCSQYAWLMLYRHRTRIIDPLRLPKWLIQTARRRAMRVRSGISRRDIVEVQSSAGQPAAAPDELFLQLEQRAVLEIAIERLDPRCARLIRALFLADKTMSYKEVADSLGVSANAFGPLRSRCLTRLRKILEEMEYSLD